MDKKIGFTLIASTSRGLGIIRGSLVSILVHLNVIHKRAAHTSERRTSENLHVSNEYDVFKPLLFHQKCLLNPKL